MNKIIKIKEDKDPSINEKKMHLMIGYYLQQILNKTPTFPKKHFNTLLRKIYTNDTEWEALNYLQNLFPTQDSKWIPTNKSNNFQKYINEYFSKNGPHRDKISELGREDALDIIEWLQANQCYTKYSE